VKLFSVFCCLTIEQSYAATAAVADDGRPAHAAALMMSEADHTQKHC
jgi:hypothetical protein